MCRRSAAVCLVKSPALEGVAGLSLVERLAAARAPGTFARGIPPTHAADSHRASTRSGTDKKPNIVERAINKLKNAGAVAAGYDERGYVHRGTIIAAALAIRLHT
ncbi:hypothetical protein AB0D10_13145 [Kitasatospora sp. NPDC048545]|uniref:hypothetical protein n=1 Tax=Kitasatospora sp. NPDC048545 TaxID=3157208 RepID=UPI0033DB569F